MATSTASRRSSLRGACSSTRCATPGTPTTRICVENRRRLETTDALDREIEVVEFDHRSRPVLVGDTPIVETYINAYEANGALIVPTAGTQDDEAALERLCEIVPGREVVGVPCPVIGYGGGGIHCITQQVPRAQASPD